MWYNKVRPIPIKPPSRQHKLTIRIMVLLGVLSMGFFYWEITKPEYVGYKPLYYPLIASIFYIGFRLLYEWYHYWDITVPEQPELKERLSVDVFTTFVPGEPYDMLLQTLEAIQAIEYPHTTYLCDEGDDSYLKEQCEKLGVVHVYRGTDKTNAKAGNINNAIYKHAKGDLCLILDPDHVPAPDFLDWVVPHFQDEEIGFVQVVQAYGNIYENLMAKASAQQTFQFYGPIMMSMNSYGTAQAIGANCTFRRKALDSIGGHAPGLAEDMHTSMKLHAEGWKSVYVPRVLTRGLVPNTLSAYYQQQLKWSRGVFELLMTTYPKIFRKLSWRQRLHYGLLPWHYFMGFLFLVNFFVPILSLFSTRIPMQVGLAYFLSYAAPLLISIVIIRHYVQKWVMEEDERGFHIQGGLIAIGTWWIHCLGFIYTLLRRKIPYNPTPKDGQEENTLGINIPNLALGALTIASIVYGLVRDLNPYSIIMAGFAALNVVFICFIFFASMQNRWRAYKGKIPWLDRLFYRIWRVKDWFWKVRHGSYQLLRTIALPVGALAALFLYVTTARRDISQKRFAEIKPKQSQQFIASSPHHQSVAEQADIWYFELNFDASFEEIRSILQKSSEAQKYPFIRWQFTKDTANEANLYFAMQRGNLDRNLSIWARALKTSSQIVYLAPFSELSDSTDLSNQLRLWKYTKRFLNSESIQNLLMVYQSNELSLTSNQFPGLDYANLIELRAKDIFNSSKPRVELDRFLVREEFLSQLPWFISANESLPSTAYPFLTRLFEENPNFCGLLYQDSALVPTNIPLELKARISPVRSLNFQSQRQNTGASFQDIPALQCNYFKGLEWQNTTHPLFRRVIESDFKEMKDLGILHINRYGPSIYNTNLLKEATAQGITITYCFFVGDIAKDENVEVLLPKLEGQILEQVEDLKLEPSITAWHLGDAIYNNLDQKFHHPQLLYEREKLLDWLDSLSRKIKSIDPSRPLSVELKYDANIDANSHYVYHRLPAVDAIGLSFPDDPGDVNEIMSVLGRCSAPIFIHSASPRIGTPLSNTGYRVSFNSWQDDIFKDYVSLSGLKSLNGRKKKGFADLEFGRGETHVPDLMQAEGFKVIPMARAAFAGQSQSYLCLIKKEGHWEPLSGDSLAIDWYILKLDNRQIPSAIEYLGSHGPYHSIVQPTDAYQYQIIAYLNLETYCLEAKTSLSTPLYFGPELHAPTREEFELQRKKSL